MSNENDPSITDDVVLWRRIIPDWLVDDGNGGRRLSSGAFQNASAKYHEEQMVPHGYTHSPAMSTNFAAKTTIQNFLSDSPDNFIVSFTVGLARELNQGVLSTPLPQDLAHASVTGNKKTKRIKRGFAEGCLWVKGP